MFIDFSNKKIKFNIIKSTFVPFFNPSQTKYLIDKYFSNSFNSEGVRLENFKIHKDSNLITLNLSKSDFYSLLTSNILYRKEIHEEEDEIFQILKKLKNQDVSDLTVLNKASFSNNLAVSVMLEDINLQKIIVKRTSKVAIGRSLVSVSVTGGVDYEDILDENPIFKTVKREVKEELGINISDKNITFEGIFIGPTKLQPIAICSVKINDNFQNLNFYGKDRKFEVEKITIVNDNDLKKYLKYPMTEASRFEIKRIIDKLTK